MKHSTFSHADLFILDGQNYRYMSAAAEGIVLTRTDPPHSSRALSHAELEALRHPRGSGSCAAAWSGRPRNAV